MIEEYQYFLFSGYVTAPEAFSASANYVTGGYDIAKAIAEKIGGKGNVLLVSGIAGFLLLIVLM